MFEKLYHLYLFYNEQTNIFFLVKCMYQTLPIILVQRNNILIAVFFYCKINVFL